MIKKNHSSIVFTILLNLIVVLYSLPATASFTYKYGGYSVGIIEDTGPDWNKDGSGDFYIYHPTDMIEGSHPIIIFCVGTGAHPETSYGDYLREYASHGFVVIAGTDENQKNGDQAVCGLDYIIAENSNPKSIFHQKLDTSNIMSAGHSQGGNACLHVAIKDPRVTSVLAMMPGKGRVQGATTADTTKLVVPVFYVTAATDFIVWPNRVRRMYFDNTKNADAWFVRLFDIFLQGHYAYSEGISIVLKAWMYANLYHDPTAITFLSGADWVLTGPFVEGGELSYSSYDGLLVTIDCWYDDLVVAEIFQNWQRLERNF